MENCFQPVVTIQTNMIYLVKVLFIGVFWQDHADFEYSLSYWFLFF